ncbi:hydrogenase maturation peptidase HycI [Methanobacterium movens]
MIILTMGNELRGDDGLGPCIAQKLSPLIGDSPSTVVIDGGAVPENFTGAIRKEKPSHILIIDAVDMGELPGHIRIIKTEEIANYNISTHAMPLSFLIKYMQSDMDVEVVILGLQPGKMEIGSKISKEVKKSIDTIIEFFKDNLIID